MCIMVSGDIAFISSTQSTIFRFAFHFLKIVKLHGNRFILSKISLHFVIMTQNVFFEHSRSCLLLKGAISLDNRQISGGHNCV